MEANLPTEISKADLGKGERFSMEVIYAKHFTLKNILVSDILVYKSIYYFI